MNLGRLWQLAKEWLFPRRKLQRIEGDVLPSRLPWRNLFLLTEDGEDWCVAFRCPCGCGQRIELALIEEAVPRWSLKLDKQGCPSLHPSVWLREGCRSHFFLRDGKIIWV